MKRNVRSAIHSLLAVTLLLSAVVLPGFAQTTNPDDPISAVGKIQLVIERPVVLLIDGMVENVAVEVGDIIKAGDPLLVLDSLRLEEAVKLAEIGLEQAQINLRTVSETVDASAIVVAEANLLATQENLTLVSAGPSAEELAAAKSSAAAAWSAYTVLQAGPLQLEIDQLVAALKLAEIDLQEAQRAYDEVKWMSEVGMMPQAGALQRATINYEATKASYDLSSQPAKTADLQQALAAAQSAQNALNQLQKQPTPAQLADAKAQVAAAQSALDKLKSSSKAGELRSAELAVERASIDLASARRDLANAKLMAPIAGTVLTVGVQVGQLATGGSTVFTLADTSKLQLVVNVEQRDLAQVHAGQKATIAVSGFSERAFTGVVERIAPQSNSDVGTVTFPVTIRLTDDEIEGLLPGMAATATFEDATNP